jgi:tetratricopeptide (TPR) repeat protein
MGTVYLARRVEDFEQQVALKLIGAAMSPSLLRRFHAERQLLARLDHPNIVRLLGGGTTGDRVPYLVMEYVDGGPLDRHCRGYSLPVRDRVGKFLAVVRAVAYAHALGFLHRDLKPANILVTAGGEPKVTDFGLARPVEPQRQVTATGEGAILGTPGYMAPEQILGGVGRNGPGVDCYGLGAVLYRLLTDRHPFEGESPFQTCLKVTTEEPVPVRRRRPDVPRDLEAVVLKSMAKDPTGRYASPGELADDLQRFLDGRPVRARRATLRDRAARWAWRHRTLVAAGVVLVSLAAVGLAAALVVTARERAKADANFHLARRFVDDFYNLSSEDPRLRAPGMQAERQRFLALALRYYQEFLVRSGRDPALRAEAARARFQVGEIVRQIGSRSEALGHLKAAQALYAGLLAADPRNTAYREDLARAQLGCASLLSEAGRPGDADRFFRSGLVLWEHLVEEHPDVSEYRERLADALSRLSIHQMTCEGREAAMRTIESAGAFYRRLAEERPDVPGLRAGLAGYYLDLGCHYRDMGQADASDGAFSEAVKRWDELAAAAPQNPAYVTTQARAYLNLGSLRRERRDVAGARAALVKARAVWEPLVAANPRVTEYRDGQARCVHLLGLIARDTGDPAAALRLYAEAIALRRQIAAYQPDWEVNNLMLGLAYCSSGTIHHGQGRHGPARGCFREAIRVFDESLARNPYDPGILAEQVDQLVDCVEADCRDPAHALDLARKAAQRAPVAVDVYRALARASFGAGDWGAAAGALKNAMDMQSGGTAIEWYLMAMVEAKLGRPDEARRWYDKAVAWTETNRPNDTRLLRLRSAARELLGSPPPG